MNTTHLNADFDRRVVIPPADAAGWQPSESAYLPPHSVGWARRLCRGR